MTDNSTLSASADLAQSTSTSTSTWTSSQNPSNLHLRQRAGNAPQSSETTASTPTQSTQATQKNDEEKEKSENVMGRTPDGIVFKVPHTPDMLTSIFHPRQPKTPLDILTILSLSLQLAIYFLTSRTFSKFFFFFYFAVWRASYNAGLGYILKQQSEHGWIVKQVKRRGWFDEKKQPKIKEWIKQQLVTKMDKDYDFDAMPIDYNIWLMFRSIVDVILLNDFVAYSLFAFSCTRLPAGHSMFLHVLRWIVGWGLIFFNLWVKMDAHRVVKDYAWYWGDCFFLCLQSLVFDGVYEIAPDPMYSLGYAGYYGLSLVSGSYAVLFVSLAAHASQFLFLQWFENPHIERTYGEKKPLAARVPLRTAPYNKASAEEAAGVAASKVLRDESEVPSPKSPSLPELRTPSQTDGSTAASDEEALDEVSDTPLSDIKGIRARNSTITSNVNGGNGKERIIRPRSESRSWDSEPQHITNLHDLHHLLFRKDTVIFKNLDLLRGTDFLLVVAVFYGLVPYLLPSLGPKSTLALLYANALGWRLIHSFGLGSILSKQSKSKWMVRHFIKHYNYEHSSEAVLETFANWKVIYNTSLVMTYLSFGVLCWKCYAPLGRDWTVGTDLLRHVLGALLIALHMWTANSSYKVLGPFGWLYGDFFIDDYPHQLFYTGIYRFLNNPERSMGGAAFFGLVLISGSKLVTTLAIISQVAHWIFLSTVEGPHMRKLYGEAALNRDGGVTKQLKNVAERNSYLFKAAQRHPKVKEMQENFEQIQKSTSVALEEFVNKQKPKINGIVEDTKSLIQHAGNRLLIVRKGENLDTIDRSQYTVSVDSPSSSSRSNSAIASSSSKNIPRFHLGEPIPVNWKAASNHSRRDWIGIYLISRFGSNPNSADEQGLITEISSQGKWLGVAENEWDGDVHTGPKNQNGLENTKKVADSVTGVSTFKSKKLPWVAGLYEVRYHHDAKHNVLARSGPIEIYVDTPANPDSFEETYSSLARIVTLSLDSDESLAPRSQTGRPKASTQEETPKGLNSDEDPDDFTIWDKIQASRISSAIKQAYGDEFSTEVVVASANVRKLARDVVEARQLLEGGFKPNMVVDQ